MLDTETKHRIDTARDILVGKVPDPKSQVEQITIALIYKFMDDMDAMSEELGGERSFFAGEFARYGWAKLMQLGLGGHEMLNLYAEAIERMDQNAGIPQLFRDIFSNAFLPYRDPETLRAFLKVIDDFTYDHSERLGDAFEYLLSVMDSQGDAGQFRTPRHIIDFIVAIVDPHKDDTVLDPACGTGGFLISSYKHILAANTDADGNSTLTPDERARLAKSVRGYDISPDMVRLSLVNMYLHGFVAPQIVEYDTLTSEENWNEYADVILANPPFMSPKGGIRPHSRFSMNSKRSEVLFVDYMAEHLNAGGRAGIIVPEGIIFQSQNAHKQLRKKLVEDCLVAVVSLPAGVFNPYSGVKTSILLLDKALARKTDRIAFFKVENDGYNLGAQRRPIEQNDLPQVKAEIAAYMQSLRAEEAGDDDQPAATALAAERGAEYTTVDSPKGNGLIVEKEKVAGDGEYNLSGERYRERSSIKCTGWPTIRLGEIAEYINGFAFKPADWKPTGRKIIRIQNLTGTSSSYNHTERTDIPSKYVVRRGDLLISWSATIGFYIWDDENAYLNQHIFNVLPKPSILKKYFYYCKERIVKDIKENVHGNTMRHITKGSFESIQIPLPPLEVQQEIVAEIEDYQKVIDGARAVVENYRPHIHVDPDWPIVTFSEAPFEIIDGDRGVNYPKKEDFSSDGYCVFLNTKNVRPNGFDFEDVAFISRKKDEALRKGRLCRKDVVITTRGTVGNTGYYDNSVPFDRIRINSGMLIFRVDESRLSGEYLFLFFQSQNFKRQRESIVSGSAQPQLPIRSLNQAILPVPTLETQQAIVAEIEAEQALVNANRELIERFESKIKDVIARTWAKDKPNTKTLRKAND